MARVKYIAIDSPLHGLYFYSPELDPAVDPNPLNGLLKKRADQAMTSALRLERRLARPNASQFEVAP